jgi:membrane protein
VEQQTKIQELLETLTNYIDAKMDIIKYDIKSDLSKVIVNMLFGVFMLLLVSVVFILLSLGLAEYLNARLNSIYVGYVILAGFYFLILVIIFLIRKYTKLTERIRIAIMELLDPNDKDEPYE